ncbi:MAG: haloalkane dehalogenase [Chloroflexota bacterium]
MKALRTPDERFKNLPGYNFEPHYVEVPDGDGGTLRVHYIDEGLRDTPPILLMHGEPSWAYLYRKMIPILVAAGHRAIAPDLIGFGRSDKPDNRENYTYQRHVDWMTSFIKAIDLQHATLVCQDWGGLIGLRLAAENPDRFARIVAANTFLPTGDQPAGEAFLRWQQYSQEVPDFDAGRIVGRTCKPALSDEIVAAYNAPYPDDSFKEGARQFPKLVPTKPDDPSAAANRKAWEVLRTWDKPFLTAFGDSDPITRGGDRAFQAMVPGTKGQPHTTIEGGTHFIQEDRGEELAKVIVEWLKA